MKIFNTFMIMVALHCSCYAQDSTFPGLPLYYWQQNKFVNFGDYLALKIVERIVGGEVAVCKNPHKKTKKILSVGSILIFANTDDVIWGTGMNGKRMSLNDYKFKNLDVRAVRGPLTRQFLMDNFYIECPEVYGDPALLMPYFFPEFKKQENPSHEYLIIPHYADEWMFPKSEDGHVVYPTDPWRTVIRKILDSKFVISGSLHGVIVAEAYGIPARYLRVSEHEPLYKYEDYYRGTNRPEFQIANSVEEALMMGGEPHFECDLEKLYQSFPFEYWPSAEYTHPAFQEECR